MSDLLSWVRRRSPAAPEVLVAAIGAAAARHDAAHPGAEGMAGEELPRELAETGLAALAAAAHGAGDRASANGLLAADALLTYACEAAAEEGAESLDALLRTLTAERFERLLGEPGAGAPREGTS